VELRAVGAVLLHVDEGTDVTKVIDYFVTLRMRRRAVKFLIGQAVLLILYHLLIEHY
jgi:hypothetical protein